MVGATPTQLVLLVILKKVMLITKTIEIDMGHRVPNHKSKCRNLHGHRYKIEVGVDDKVINEKGVSNEGMVIDFSDLKEIMMREIDAEFDHSSIFYQGDNLGRLIHFLTIKGDKRNVSVMEGVYIEMIEEKLNIHLVDFVPTAENLAKHWFELIEKPLQEKGIKLSYVKVWETPTSTAIYTLTDK